MTQKTFNLATGVIFVLLALLHLYRALSGWPVILVSGWAVPTWMSWIGLIVAGGLGYCGLALARRS